MTECDHVLYRCFDADGQLLYIGITNDVDNRLRQHSQSSAWWRDTARYTVDDCFGTRDEVEQAERAAIKAELPKYNLRDNPKAPYRAVPAAVWQRVCDDLDELVRSATAQQIGDAS